MISFTVSRISTSCAAPVFGMRLQLPPLGPIVGLVVVVHVAEQQAALVSCGRSAGCRCLTRTDQKFLSFAWSSLWKLIPGIGGFDLQVEGRRFYRFLLVAVRRARLSVKVSAMRKPYQGPSGGSTSLDFLCLWRVPSRCREKAHAQADSVTKEFVADPVDLSATFEFRPARGPKGLVRRLARMTPHLFVPARL